MLNCWFGKDFGAVVRIDDYFKYAYADEWFKDDIVRQIVHDIDGSEVHDMCIISPVLGQVSPEWISGSAKALILIYKGSTTPVDLVCCGENCEDWIIRLSHMVDRDITMSGFDLIFRGRTDLNLRCDNDGKEIKDWNAWVDSCQAYIGKVERNNPEGVTWIW